MRTTSFLSPVGGAMLVLLLCAISSVNSYSKYGRGCGDIGCLPNEVCVLSHDSCGFGQRDGKECGNYPTCKKSGAASSNSGGVKPSDDDDKFNGFVLSQADDDDDDADGLLYRVARSIHSGIDETLGNTDGEVSELKTKKESKFSTMRRIGRELLNKFRRKFKDEKAVSPPRVDKTITGGKENIHISPISMSQQYGANGKDRSLRVERAVSENDENGLEFEPIAMSKDANVHLQVQGYGLPSQRNGPGNGQGNGPNQGNGQGQGPNRQGVGQQKNGMQRQQQRGPGMQGGPNGRGSQGPWQGQRQGQGQGQVPGRGGYNQGPNGRPNQNGLGNGQNGRMGGGGGGVGGGRGQGQGPRQGQGRGGMRQGQVRGGVRQGGPGQGNNQGRSTTTPPVDAQYQDEDQHQDYDGNVAYDQDAGGEVQSLKRFARAIDEHVFNGNLEELQMTDDLLHHPSSNLLDQIKPTENHQEEANDNRGNVHRVARGLFDKFNRKEKKNDGDASPAAASQQTNTNPTGRPQQTGNRQNSAQKTGANSKPKSLHRVARGLLDKFKRKDKKNDDEASLAATSQQTNTNPTGRPQQTFNRQNSVQKTGANSKPKSLHRIARGLLDKFKRKDKKNDDEASSAAASQQTNTNPTGRPQQTGNRQNSAQKTGANSKPKSLHRVARGLLDKFKRKDKKNDGDASPAATSQQPNTNPTGRPQQTGNRQNSAQKTGANSKPKSLHRVARGLLDKFKRKDTKNDGEASPAATSQQMNTNPTGRPQQTGNRQNSAQKTGANNRPKSLHRVARGLLDKFKRKDKKNDGDASPAATSEQTNTNPTGRPQQTGNRQNSAQKTGANNKPKSLHRVARGLLDKFKRKDKKNDEEASPAATSQQMNTNPTGRPQQTGNRQNSVQKTGANNRPKSLHRVARGLLDKFKRKDKKNDDEASPAATSQQTNTNPTGRPQQTGNRQNSAQKTGANSKPKSLHRVARGLLDKFKRKDKKNDGDASPAATSQQTNTNPTGRPQQTGNRQNSAQKTGANNKPKSLHRVARGLLDKFKRKDKKNDDEASLAATNQQTNTNPTGRPQQTGNRQNSAQKTGANNKPKSLHRVARGLLDKFKRKDKKNDEEASPAATNQQTNTNPTGRPQQTGNRQNSAQKTGANNKPKSLHRVARGLLDKFKRKDKKNDGDASPAATSQQMYTNPTGRPQQTGNRQNSVQKTGANNKPKSLHRVARGLLDKFKRKDKKNDDEASKAATSQQTNTNPTGRPQQTGNRQNSAQKTGANNKPKSLHRVARGLFDKFKRKDTKNNAETPSTNTTSAARAQQNGSRQGSAQKPGANGKMGTLRRVARGLLDKFNRKNKKNDTEASSATVGQPSNTNPRGRPQRTGATQGRAQSTAANGNIKSLQRVTRSIISRNDNTGFHPKMNSEQVNQNRQGQGQNRQRQNQNRNGQSRQGQGQNRQGQGQSRQSQAQRQNTQSNNNNRSAPRPSQNKRQDASTNGRIGYSQRSSDGRTGVTGSGLKDFQSRSGSQMSPDRSPDQWSQDSRYRDYDRGYDRYSGYDSNYNGYDERRGPPPSDWHRTSSQSHYPHSWGPPQSPPPPSSSNTYQSSYGSSPLDYQSQRADVLPPSQQGGYQTDYQTSSHVYYPASGSTQNGYSTQVGVSSQAYTQGAPSYIRPGGPPPAVSSSGYTFVQFPNGTSIHYAVAMEPVATTTINTTEATNATTAAVSTTTPKK